MHNQHQVILSNCQIRNEDFEISLVGDKFFCSECNYHVGQELLRKDISLHRGNVSLLLKAVRNHVLYHKAQGHIFQKEYITNIETEINYAQRIEECQKNYNNQVVAIRKAERRVK